MKILTLCKRGDHRSVCMASVLRNERKYRDVISAGVYTFSQETLAMLYDWADKIIVVDGEIGDKVHPEFQDKVLMMDLGPDPYGPNFHEGFKTASRDYLDQAGL